MASRDKAVRKGFTKSNGAADRPGKVVPFEEEEASPRRVVARAKKTNGDGIIMGSGDILRLSETTSSPLTSSVSKTTRKSPGRGEDEEVDTDDQTRSPKKKFARLSEQPSEALAVAKPILQSSQKSPQRKRKAYYPIIPLTEAHMSEMRVAARDSSKRALVEMVRSVCALEKEGLRQYFSSKYPDKALLLKTLENILDALPDELSKSVAEDASFVADAGPSSSAKAELTEAVEQLQREADALAVFEEDPSAFLREHGLFDNLAPRDPLPVREQDDDRVGTLQRRCAEVLNQLEQHCNAVVAETVSLDALLGEAWQTQERLFSAFQTIRSDEALRGRRVPDRPQDLVRGLSKM